MYIKVNHKKGNIKTHGIFYDKLKKNKFVDIFLNTVNYLCMKIRKYFVYIAYVYLAILSETIVQKHENSFAFNETGISAERLRIFFNGIYVCIVIQGVFLKCCYHEICQKDRYVNYINKMLVCSILPGICQIIFGYCFATHTILRYQFYKKYFGTYVFFVCCIVSMLSIFMSFFIIFLVLSYFLFLFHDFDFSNFMSFCKNTINAKKKESLIWCDEC